MFLSVRLREQTGENRTDKQRAEKVQECESETRSEGGRERERERERESSYKDGR
jgi:hypothetical protein